MRTLSLNRTATVTLNGSGNGTAQLGPASPGEVWEPSVVSVSVGETSVTDEAQCKIYCGPTAASPSFVDGTLSGSTGDSTTNVAGQKLYPGQYIFAVWTGGDPGKVAVMSIQGTRNVP